MSAWMCASALILSVGWLLPTHHAPWATFQSDAWIAGVLLLIALVPLFKTKARLPLSLLMLLAAGLCLVPIFQLYAGQIKLTGTAWISFVYLLGFLLAILTGARWQKERGDQLAAMLFLAVGIAATVSVGLQLCQWLSVSEGCLCADSLIFQNAENRRASASLAQPNQLATLHIWGLLACAWAWVRRWIRGPVAVFAISYLLLGLAITESRTGAFALGLMVVGTWHWKHLWPSERTPLVVALLFVGYVLIAVSLVHVSHALLLDYSPSWFERTVTETRFDIWATFASAAIEHPWLGHGWSQSLLSQASPETLSGIRLEMYRFLGSFSHNLFLDLLLWLGVPLGIMVSAVLVGWVTYAIRSVKNHQDALLVMVVIAVGTHAMFELPLYYAYFLLPLGLVVGMIDVGLFQRRLTTISLPMTVVTWVVASISFAVTLRDYLLVEDLYAQLRLEEVRISGQVQRPQQEVWVLTQLRDFIILARTEPLPNISTQQMEWIRNVALAYPSSQNLLKLATVLAFQGDTTQARLWLVRLCAMSTKEQCVAAQTAWSSLQSRYPQLGDVRWPDVAIKAN